VTSSSCFPRPEQIDELTRGLELPFPALHDEHLALIADVLALAWSDLAQTRGQILSAGTEAEINALMETRLNRMIDELPVWEQLVRSVARGKETLSFDGTNLEKRPDLSLHLWGRTPSFPLIVECKLIEATSGKTRALYCNEGLKRFLTGEYGWAVREAFMLAYVRDQSTTESCLVPFLRDTQKSTLGPYEITGLSPAPGNLSHDVALSAHQRAFRYSGRRSPGDDPGPISIWHLWVQVAEQASISADPTAATAT